ncbi:hypothetical protein J6590_094446 [Homalodisca vitripennis]|nr:hypothetical protein J6590_092594 [Homalodisca vitripennis]KAG8334263.1 hypothetical protein J6590_094446 [Homalodisca vitripennis]
MEYFYIDESSYYLSNFNVFIKPDYSLFKFFYDGRIVKETGFLHVYLTFYRVFRTQKKAVRIISKLKRRESCKIAFWELGFLTSPSLYTLDVTLYCRFKCELVQGRDVHQCEPRGRNNFRTEQYRTAMFEHLSSQMGVKLINKLPGDLKRIIESKKFKYRLRHSLLSKAFYSVDDLTMDRWDEN